MMRGLRYPWDISMMEAEGFEPSKTTGTGESDIGPTAILPVEQRCIPPQNPQAVASPAVTPKRADDRGTAESSKQQPSAEYTASPRALRAARHASRTSPPAVENPEDVITPLVTKKVATPTPIKKRALETSPPTRNVRQRLDLDSEPAQLPAAEQASQPAVTPASILKEQVRASTPADVEIVNVDEGGWSPDDEESPPTVADFSWDGYESYPARVDIFTIVFPEDKKSVRNVDSAHVGNVMDKMFRFGFLPNMGTLTVTSLDAEILRDMPSNITD